MKFNFYVVGVIAFKKLASIMHCSGPQKLRNMPLVFVIIPSDVSLKKMFIDSDIVIFFLAPFLVTRGRLS